MTLAAGIVASGLLFVVAAFAVGWRLARRRERQSLRRAAFTMDRNPRDD